MNTARTTTTPPALTKRQELERKLKNHFFIVGGGAWQKLWEPGSTRSMGFGSSTSDSDTELFASPDYNTLKSSIQPELLKRFSSDILIMHPLTRSDYQQLSAEFAQSMTSSRQIKFTELVEKHIDKAVEDQIGMRFFETIFRQVLIIEKRSQSIIRASAKTKDQELAQSSYQKPIHSIQQL